MLRGLFSQNYLVAFINDNEIYLVVVRVGIKKGNVYELGTLSKKVHYLYKCSF